MVALVPRPLASRVGAIASLLLVTACAGDSLAPADAGIAAPNRSLMSLPRLSQRYVLVHEAGAAPSAAAVTAAGAVLVGRIEQVDAVVVDFARSERALAAIRGVTAVLPSLEHDLAPVVGTAEAAGRGSVSLGTDQSGAFFFATGRQWNLDERSIRADEVWADSRGGEGARVCVIDSGIDATHQEVRGKVVAQTSFIPNPGNLPQAAAIDSNFHGTHVATTVTSNGVGLASVAPDASLMAAKVFNAAGGGATLDRIFNAIIWCTDNGADVINMSLGFTGGIARAPNADIIAIYQQVVDYATSQGVVVVSSSGNDNRQLPNATRIWLPAELDGVLNVGATGPVTANPPGWPVVLDDTWDRKAFYSNYGVGVGVFAPGGRGTIPLSFRPRGQGSGNDAIIAACASASPYGCGGGTFYIGSSGTSMAAPHVAGLAALLRAEIGGERSVATAERVMSCITESTVDIGPASTFGGGRIDVAAAMARLESGGC